MWAGSKAARGPPTRGNDRRAGVAQSVAQLSCKQQVRGSSPLASSISWPSQTSILLPRRSLAAARNHPPAETTKMIMSRRYRN